MKRIIEYPERTKSYEIGDVVYLSPSSTDKVKFLGENIEVAKGIKKVAFKPLDLTSFGTCNGLIVFNYKPSVYAKEIETEDIKIDIRGKKIMIAEDYITITDKKEVTTNTTEFKNGDFCHVLNGGLEYIFIYKMQRSKYTISYHVLFEVKPVECIKCDNWCTAGDNIRLATEKEKSLLISKLKEKEYLDWDDENKLIIPYKWIPEEGDTYYYIDEYFNIGRSIYNYNTSRGVNSNRIKNNNYFKTREQIEKYVIKFKELLEKRNL